MYSQRILSSIQCLQLAGNCFRDAASDYLKKAGETHGTVEINVSVGMYLIGNLGF